MKIQVNTDSSIEGDQRLEEYVEELITERLGRFREHLTRVEVHIRDENADKGGSDDHRCVVEARPKGMGPISVDHRAADAKGAISGAIAKSRRALDSALGKRNSHR